MFKFGLTSEYCQAHLHLLLQLKLSWVEHYFQFIQWNFGEILKIFWWYCDGILMKFWWNLNEILMKFFEILWNLISNYYFQLQHNNYELGTAQAQLVLFFFFKSPIWAIIGPNEPHEQSWAPKGTKVFLQHVTCSSSSRRMLIR